MTVHLGPAVAIEDALGIRAVNMGNAVGVPQDLVLDDVRTVIVDRRYRIFGWRFHDECLSDSRLFRLCCTARDRQLDDGHAG